MRNILSSVHKTSRRVFVFGWIAVAAIVASSTVFYIGAGTLFDYYSAVCISENLLAFSRPSAVAVCVFSLLIEYRSRQKNDSTD